MFNNRKGIETGGFTVDYLILALKLSVKSFEINYFSCFETFSLSGLGNLGSDGEIKIMEEN